MYLTIGYHLREYCRIRIIRAMILACLLVPLCGCTEKPPEDTNPDLPTGEYCLTRINKSLDGFLNSELISSYNCPSGETERRSMQLNVRVMTNGGAICDEAVPGFVETAFLVAEGNVVVRSDSLAHFLGQFQINNGDEVKLFEGTIEIIGKIGTHQPGPFKSCEEICIQDKHMEGWLVGSGVGGMSKYNLRAMLAIDVGENLPTTHSLIQSTSRMVGVLIEAP